MFTFANIFIFSYINLIIIYLVETYLSNRRPKPIIISIDGNIGSGKSTLIKILQESLPQDKIYFAPEPVDTWTSIVDDNGKNLLHNFYDDKERWSYIFQNFTYITRIMELKKAQESKRPIIITERSVMTDRNVFAKMLHESNSISNMEMDIYNYWYDSFNMEITKTVYLKTSVTNCLSRIKKRSRDSETEIDSDYLLKLEMKHDDWLLNDDNTLILNGDVDFVNDHNESENLINEIKKCLYI